MCAVGALWVAGACAAPSADRSVAAPRVVDDFGDTLLSTRPAAHIVSLNPVATEALFAMGAGSRVIGRTHWDGSPPEVKHVADLGDGLQPNIEAVVAAHADLVVLYASPANRAAVVAFHRAGISTISLRTDRVADFARLMRALGRAVGDSAAAQHTADSVAASLDVVRAAPRYANPPTVFWHAWDAPVITIGSGSFLHELVVAAGAKNVFDDLPQPSPQVTLEAVAQRNPRFVLAGPRTAHALAADARWRAVEAIKRGRVLTIDTALLARPGVRMGEAARSLRQLLDSAQRAHP